MLKSEQSLLNGSHITNTDAEAVKTVKAEVRKQKVVKKKKFCYNKDLKHVSLIAPSPLFTCVLL